MVTAQTAPLLEVDEAMPAAANDGAMKLALGIEYDGSAYYGWQRQQEVPSVQACLERALSTVADEPVAVHCAGRTDAGVHATGQVVHFDTRARRPDAAWTLGVNANLPADIAVRWVAPVADDFHARFSATARRYRYIIYNHRLRPALLGRGLTHYYHPLDALSMARAGQCLLGRTISPLFAPCSANRALPGATCTICTSRARGNMWWWISKPMLLFIIWFVIL
ncbi:tRNA pseudouridine synthase A [Sodalis praecaptivus]